MAQQETLALVATAVDRASGPLREIGRAMAQLKKDGDLSVHSRSVQGFSKELDRLAKASRDLAPSGKHIEDFSRRWREFTGGINETSKVVSKELLPALSGISIGAVTAGGAIAALIERIKSFGEAGAEVGEFATQVGASAKNVQSLTGAAEHFGSTGDKMKGILRSISTELAQANRPQGGEYWQQLMRHGQVAEADAVRRLGTTKKLSAEQKSEALLQQQLAHAERVYKQYGESTGREVLKEFGIDPDTINLVREGREALQHERDKINKVLGDPDTAGGKAYVRAWGDLKLEMQGVGNAIAIDLLPHLTEVTHRMGEFVAANSGQISLGITKAIKELGGELKSVRDLFKQVSDYTPQWVKNLGGQITPTPEKAARTPEGTADAVKEGMSGVDELTNLKHQWWKDLLTPGKKAGAFPFFRPALPESTEPAPAIPPPTEAQKPQPAPADVKRDSRGRVLPDQNTPQYFADTPVHDLLADSPMSDNIEDRRNLEADTSATVANTEQLKRLNEILERGGGGPLAGTGSPRYGFTGAAAGGDAGDDPASGTGGGIGGGGIGGIASMLGQPGGIRVPPALGNVLGGLGGGRGAGGGGRGPGGGAEPVTPAPPPGYGGLEQGGSGQGKGITMDDVQRDVRGAGRYDSGSKAAGKNLGPPQVPNAGEGGAPPGAVTATNDQARAYKNTGNITLTDPETGKQLGSYPYVTGGGGKGSIPPGQYNIDPSMMRGGSLGDRWKLTGVGQPDDTAQDPGIPGVTPPSGRGEFRIHQAHGPGTLGCVGILGGDKVYADFKKNLLIVQQKNGGRTTLNIGDARAQSVMSQMAPVRPGTEQPIDPTHPAAQQQQAGGGGAVPNALSNWVAKKEAFSGTAFSDYGQTNIGYGTAANGRTSITEPEARTEMNAELSKHLDEINKLNPNLSEGSKRALASLSFNTGGSWYNKGDTNPDGSPTLKGLVKSGDVAAIQKKFLEYDKAGGKPLAGLTTRRQQEAKMFTDDAYGKQGEGTTAVQDFGGKENPATRVAGPGAGGPTIPPLEDRSSKSPYPDMSEAPEQPTIPPQAAGFDDDTYDRSRAAGRSDADLDVASGKRGLMARPPGEVSAASTRADAEAMKHTVEGTGSIKVDVNAPRGTKVTGESDGLFKRVEVNRTSPMTESTQEE